MRNHHMQFVLLLFLLWPTFCCSTPTDHGHGHQRQRPRLLIAAGGAFGDEHGIFGGSPENKEEQQLSNWLRPSMTNLMNLPSLPMSSAAAASRMPMPFRPNSLHQQFVANEEGDNKKKNENDDNKRADEIQPSSNPNNKNRNGGTKNDSTQIRSLSQNSNFLLLSSAENRKPQQHRGKPPQSSSTLPPSSTTTAVATTAAAAVATAATTTSSKTTTRLLGDSSITTSSSSSKVNITADEKTTNATNATNLAERSKATTTTTIIVSTTGENRKKRRDEFYKKVHNVPIQDEHALHIYQHWAEQAFSSLFAVVANQRLKQFARPVHDDFGECSKRVKSVPEHARCVSDLLNGKMDGEKFIQAANQKSTRFDKYRMKKRGQFRRRKLQQPAENWIGSFKMMRDQPIIVDGVGKSNEQGNNNNNNSSSASSTAIPIPALDYAAHRRERRQTGIVKKNFYALMTPSQQRLSPLGKMAQQLMDKVLKAKGKAGRPVVPWQNAIERIQNSAKRRKDIKKALESDDVQSMDQLTYRGLKKQGAIPDGEDLNEVMENPGRLRDFLKRKQKEGAASGSSKPMHRLVTLLRDGIKLGYAFAGKNSTDLENKTLKMVSPRFLSVTPEQDPEHNETVDFLSPSLFSVHGQGKGIENLTSLPNILRSIGGPIGFSAQDQQMWLDFIMEASGVIEDAEKIEEELNNTAGSDPLKTVWERHFDKEKYEREIRTKDGTPLYFTKQNISDGFAESEVQKVDLFEVLQKKIDKGQVHDMNNTGYAFLSAEQLDLLYGKQSPYHDPELLERFKSLDHSKMGTYIERDIHTLAQLKSFKIRRKELPPTSSHHTVEEAAEEEQMEMETETLGGSRRRNRTKRQVILSPITFTPFVLTFLNMNPIILSPIIFSPIILSPAVLGPVILSPWAFVPLILSPRLLSPLILSPPVFAPLVLTPLALHPVILSPGAFVPLILSPLVLTPFILSPQVFTPFILSPFALSPFILNPAAASPIVLSPYVLSPIILSPQFFSALVLSPYAFSPIIQSPLVAYSVILSPSYLS